MQPVKMDISADTSARRHAWHEMPVIVSVDDDHQLLFLYWQSFGQAGYRCVPCVSAEAALDAVSALPVSLVTMDFNMPGRNGAELAREIRSMRPEVPIVLLTGAVSTGTEDLSCFDCVHRKGGSMRRLFENINELLMQDINRTRGEMA